MTMFRKHYNMIAKCFAETRMTKDVCKLALKLCDTFKEDNPRFNKQKFLGECDL